MLFLVVGDANADLSAVLPSFPREGDDHPLRDLTWGSGGSAANVATALARIGARSRLLARVGRDPAASFATLAARQAGVDLCLQVDPALATGLCFAAVSPGGERTFFSFRGANAALEPPDPDAAFRAAGWLHVAGHALLEGRQRDSATALLAEAERRGIAVSIDLCLPLVRERPAEILDLAPRAAVLFANEPELVGLAGSLDDALVALERRGAPIIAAKLGARGSRIAGRSHAHAAPFVVEAADTTGAGDAYVAAFLDAHTRGAPPEIAARIGNAAGALTACRAGAADALPTRAEVHHFLAARGAHRELTLLSGDPTP